MKHMMIKVLSLVMALTMIMGMFGAVALSAAEHVHTKGDKVKTVAPTCVAYGYTLYECADCGETYADDILAKTEECQNIVDVKEVAATCTSDAKTAGKKCADCGTYTEGGETIPGTKLQHNMVIAITQPTCDADGEVYQYCSLCNKERSQIMNLAALGVDGKHVTDYVITKAPSCGESGLATWGCTHCDDYTVEGIYVAPNPDLHEWVKVDDKPTCEAAGFLGWECTECWATTDVNPETGVKLENGGLIPAYNHSNDVVVITKDNYHGYAYFINNEFKPEDLELKPTCTDEGFHYVYCNDCKQILKLTDKALGHTFENWYNEDTSSEVAEYIVEKVDATCENAGYVVVRCDNYAICDCEETKTIIQKDALSKDHKHDWWSELTTQYKGNIEDGYKWNRVEATCTSAGYTVVTCKNKGCTATRKFDAVDALGHNYEYRCDVCGDAECLNCTHNRRLECVDNDDRDGCGATIAVTVETAHNMSKDKDVKTVPATCSQYAYDTYYCKNKDCDYIGDTLYQYAVKDGNGNVIFDTEAGYDADNHSALEEMIVTYPTCLAEGKAVYSCKNCSVGTWEEAIPVLEGHDEYRSEVAEKKATCQNTGWTAGIHCYLCELAGRGETEVFGNGKEYGYIKGCAKTAKNAANHEVDGALELFHRPGTCNIKELTVYQCVKCSTNEKNIEFNVEGSYDEYNHNKYVYVNNALDATQSSSTVTEAPSYVGEETHWGACIKYTPAIFTCEDAGNHANLKCTACAKVLGVTEYEFVKYTAAAVADDPATPEDETAAEVTAADSLLWVLNKDTNGDGRVTVEVVVDNMGTDDKADDVTYYSDVVCPVCRAYHDKTVDANADKTAEWEESPHITYEYIMNDDGSYYIDPTSKKKVVESYEVDLALPAVGHDFVDVDAEDETCDAPGHTAGQNCVSNIFKNLAAYKQAIKDGYLTASESMTTTKLDAVLKAMNDKIDADNAAIDADTTLTDTEKATKKKDKLTSLCNHKVGQTFIPAHDDAYVVVYEGKAPTCTSYGIGYLATAFTYQNSRYEKFVVIGAFTNDDGSANLYDGQAIVKVDGAYKVVDKAELDKLTNYELVVDATQIDTTMFMEPDIYDATFELVDTNYNAAVSGKWCSKCEDKVDITKRPYYIAPLAHNYVITWADEYYSNYNACTDFNWAEIKCTACTADGPHWTDKNGDNKVDVNVKWGDNAGVKTIENAAELELSWFFTSFDYADGHDYPEVKKVEDVTTVGWLIMGEIFTDAEVAQLKADGYENLLGPINTCTTDRIKYVSCPDCGERKSVGDVIAATGHYINETDGSKKPISMDCHDYEQWINYTCAGCSTTITKNLVPTHDLVHVNLKETCTKEGLVNCWACVNCDEHYFLMEEAGVLDIVKIDFTPTEAEAEAAVGGYDLALMEAIVDAIIVPKHNPVITKVDEYVPATETKDGYWVYTCGDCGETVKKVLKAEAKLALNITVEDVNGAKVTANGNEIVVKVAYTAKEYKFRALDLGFYFNNYVLTFNKAEVKAEYDESLNVITDVAVDGNEINVLTYVPNGLKQNATLSGEKTAFIYFYFTLNVCDTVDSSYFALIDVDAKEYDPKTDKNVDQSQSVNCNFDYELAAGATGDIDFGGEIDYSDLLDMMDTIYTTDAKYNAMADINKDGVVDVEDFAALKTFVGTKQTAVDYAEMIGAEIPDLKTIALQVLNIEKLDVNGDDKINKADLDALCSADGYLDLLINDLDKYSGWESFFYSDVCFLVNMDDAEVVEVMTDIIIDAYANLIP